MKVIQQIKHSPIPTGQLVKELGISVRKDFIIRKLNVKPFLDTKTTAYWDDVPLIRRRLGTYFTRTSKL
jgi:hypothetical protein